MKFITPNHYVLPARGHIGWSAGRLILALAAGTTLSAGTPQGDLPAYRPATPPSTGAQYIHSDGTPHVTQKESELLARAAALAEQDLPAAIRLLASRVSESASPALDYMLGSYLQQAGQRESAESAYRDAVRKMPGFPAAINHLALLYLERDEPASGLETLQQLTGTGHADAYTYLLMGACLDLMHKPVSAEGAYRQALLLEPENHDARRGLARALIAQGRNREVLALSRELLEDRPADPELWRLRCTAHLALGESDAAITGIETALSLDAAPADLLPTLGNLYINRRQFKHAARAYLSYADREAPDVSRILAAANHLVDRGAFVEAEVLADKAGLELKARGSTASAGDLRVLNRVRGRLAASRGDTETAARILRNLLRDAPLDGRIMLELANILVETGEPDDARTWFERARRIAEYETEALLAQAQLEVHRGRYHDAAELLEKAAERDPSPHITRFLEQVRTIAETSNRQ